MALAFVGTLSTGSDTDVILMVIIGVCAYILRKFKFDLAPLIIAFVLAEPIEYRLSQSMLYAKGASVFVSFPAKTNRLRLPGGGADLGRLSHSSPDVAARQGARRFMRAYSSKENIMKKRFFAVLAALVLLVGLGLPSTSTAAYPDRPITLVLPVSAGGSHDLHARGITSIIADILGQPMVVKLVPGGAGMKGTGFVAKAKPDGYTLLFSHNGFDQLVPQTRKVPFNTLRDFSAVAKINHAQPVFFSLSNRPWKSMKEFVAYAKKNPGKVNWGHSGRLGGGPRGRPCSSCARRASR